MPGVPTNPVPPVTLNRSPLANGISQVPLLGARAASPLGERTLRSSSRSPSRAPTPPVPITGRPSTPLAPPPRVPSPLRPVPTPPPPASSPLTMPGMIMPPVLPTMPLQPFGASLLAQQPRAQSRPLSRLAHDISPMLRDGFMPPNAPKPNDTEGGIVKIPSDPEVSRQFAFHSLASFKLSDTFF